MTIRCKSAILALNFVERSNSSANIYGGKFMAVPKGKVSKARRDKRRANWKAAVPTLVECPHCHEKKIAHRVCKNCGYYDGEQVVNTEKKETK